MTTVDHEPHTAPAASQDSVRHELSVTPDSTMDIGPAVGSPQVGVGMSTRDQPSVLEAVDVAGKAMAERVLAELERTKAARREAWRARYQAREDARRRLAERYGSDLEKRWIADPNAPQVDAVSLLHAFLHKAGPAILRSPEMEQAPTQERDDALAAAHMIRVARQDARQREIAVMRQILAHGVTWDELANALDTTSDELTQLLRQHGEQPDTWAASAGGDR